MSTLPSLEEYAILCKEETMEQPLFDKEILQRTDKEILEYSTKHLLENYRKFNHKFYGIISSFEEIKKRIKKMVELEKIETDNLSKYIKEAIYEMSCDELMGRHVENCVLLGQLNCAVEALSSMPKHGYEYAYIIKHTYMIEVQKTNKKTTDQGEIEYCLNDDEYYTFKREEEVNYANHVSSLMGISQSSYFTKKRKAIAELSTLLWGMPTEQKKAIEKIREEYAKKL